MNQPSGIQGFLDDVPMDIGAEFFPLPVLVLNHRLKYPAQLLDETYDFDTEQKATAALDDFEAEQEQKKERREQVSATRNTLPPSSSSPDLPLKTAAESVVPRTLPLQHLPPADSEPSPPPPFLPQRSQPSFAGCGLLQPQPLRSVPAPPPVSTARSSLLDDFEACPTGNSPFDALEIHSLDDRALLRQLLQ